jgi:hypothetical protein
MTTPSATLALRYTDTHRVRGSALRNCHITNVLSAVRHSVTRFAQAMTNAKARARAYYVLTEAISPWHSQS